MFAESVAPAHPGIAVHSELGGSGNSVTLTLDTSRFGAGEAFTGTVSIETNAGTFDVPISFRIPMPWTRVAMWTLAAAIASGGILGLTRQWLRVAVSHLDGFSPRGVPEGSSAYMVVPMVSAVLIVLLLVRFVAKREE